MADIFSIAPAPPRTLMFFGVIGGFLLILLLLFAWFAYASRSARFEVSAEGLHIRSAVYGRTIGWPSLIADGVRAVSLNQSTELRPDLRTNGVGLPGYSGGWFRLRNGERALLILTDRSRVVYIPTRDGFSVLLSTDDPDGLVAALRARSSAAGPPTHR